MEMIQAAVAFLFVVIALLAMLFVALVAAASATDRARVPVAQRRPSGPRH